MKKTYIKKHLKGWCFGDAKDSININKISSDAIMLFLDEVYLYISIKRNGYIEAVLADDSIIYKTQKLKIKQLVNEYQEINCGNDYSCEQAVSDVYKMLIKEGAKK